MPNNPKIKIDADLSSVNSEIDKLKSSIVDLGNKLKTESGKSDLNFSGAQKDLNNLIAQADKLTAALDKGDKKSAAYAKNLKAAAEAMAQASKVAAKLENAGSSSNHNASNYFREFSGELRQESAGFSNQNALHREKEKVQRQLENERQANNAKWAGRAGKLAGFVGGSVTGGGGMYANLGSLVGSAFGPLGGLVGGMVGGTADRTIGSAREEAKTYSELRRMVGSTTVDFVNLRDSVRGVIHGLGVTDNEAANLAKQFAHISSLSSNSNDTIARSVGTSAGFAQGYGMLPEQAMSFFAQMRLSGNSNNDKDNRRLALMIGESVQRGGTSVKMDEVLSVVSGFATRSSQQMMTAPNVGQYSSYLASLTGSSYAGIKGDPNNAAQLMGMMDSGVSSGGTMGEASQYHWLQARQSAFKGMSAMDNSIMQTAGATGDLSTLFAPGSPFYDNANATARARMDRTRQSISGSGYRNNFEVGMAHIKSISGGDSYLENANFRGMFGGNPQQAAALMQRMEKDPGLGGFEKQLSKYGIGLDNVNVSQISSLSQLLGGGDKAMASQYEKLLGSGKMTSDELSSADKTMATNGYGEEFKKMLFKLTAKYDVDDGQKSQTTQIDISRKIQESVSGLVGIEADSREYLLRLLDKFGAAGPVVDRMVAGFKDGTPESGNNMKGGKGIGKMAMHEVDRNLKEIGMASSQDERDRLYVDFMRKVQRHPDYYPAETEAWMKKARGGHEAVSDKSPLGTDTDNPTISGVVPATLSQRQRNVIGQARMPSKYDAMFADIGKIVGLDPLVIKQIAAQESGINPNTTNQNSNGTTDLGMMQHNSRYAGGRGLGGDGWRDAYKNTLAGAKYYKQMLDNAGGDYHGAFEHYNGSGPDAKRYVDMSMGVYDTLHNDQMPTSQRSGGENSMEFRHKIDVSLWDQKGNRMADPMSISTSFGSPRPAGVGL
ncbi:MAG: transglycosylase SLT domain-containing protein [Methylobacter sp.]|uniref:transglycosylase SLT domain-containing protein n=1 Tax=Methylobacter sp. TaxID=2051955 RepID=UPI0027316941|nr:transglycosylase SLT domain-containing protein [Methylobacter sp.]MDP1664991.1 transglycosylase SLT domain-containing protein [Methylobacter sp.]